ncbi:MAG: CinA family nicotinamide mononucleotide deamidase-related protein [Candidatus Poribacteria bacterium]|nr:CinA family nicotinamide mononucleotide deamidase-related protein [Candidatus Poribacteria bacterium]
MHAEIVMIGTELLLGEIVDTNANRLAIALRDIGLDLYYKTTVGDNEARITEILDRALDRSDVVITSGGIGPTVDDLTRQAAANATGRKLVYSDELEAEIAERFRRFGREMAENNKRQAYIPEGATPLSNPVGTAPCFLSEDRRGRGCVISLPGVPRELEYMLKHSVVPLLVARMGGSKVTNVRVLRTCAVGESNVDRAIGDLMTSTNPTVGLAAHVGQTDVRIAAKADTEAEADALIAEMEATLRERLGVAVYGVGRESLPDVVGQLLDQRKLKLGVVDTLTDGQLVRDLIEAGYGKSIAHTKPAANLAEALEGSEVTPQSGETEIRAHASSLTRQVTPAGGLGLAVVGPFEENATYILLQGPGNSFRFERSRNYQDTDYIRRWLAIQGLDFIRRTLLGKLESPVD